MKLHIHHPPESEISKQGPRYWKSLDEIAQTPAFEEWVQKEFPQGASELNGIDRRGFLKIMAASFALAGFGLSGCRQPEGHILPYSKAPDGIIPGLPLYYATSIPFNYENIPLIAETHDGRPTKIEGNPSYFPYGGKTDSFAQASILDLYDPDRSSHSQDKNGQALTKLEVFDVFNKLYKTYKETQGAGLVLVAEPSASPSRQALYNKFKAVFPKAVWAEYNPVQGLTASETLSDYAGASVRPVYKLAKAKRILSLDCDFLKTEPGSLGYTRAFTASRKFHDNTEALQMSRLYTAESRFSLTGAMSDHRLRMATCQIPALTACVASVLFAKLHIGHSWQSLLQTATSSLAIDPKWIEACVDDLIAHKGNSLVVAGSHLPACVHLIVFLINHYLQAPGNTLEYFQIPETAPKPQTLKTVAQAINQDVVKTLVLLGVNPVYDAPGDLNWKRLQEKVPQVIHYGIKCDESGQKAHVHIAASHYLESWGDGRTWDGTFVPVQPMIMPLFETFGELEVLSALINGSPQDPYALVKETFNQVAPNGNFEKWLAEGVLPNNKFETIAIPVDESKLLNLVRSTLILAEAPTMRNLEVRFTPGSQVWDGRFSNNGWLQECSDSMTKLCWDNAICISPKLAESLEKTFSIELFPKPTVLNETGALYRNTTTSEKGKATTYIAALTLGNQTIQGPIHVQPGLADYSVLLTLGYGRTHAGRVGNGVGFDVYPLVQTDALGYATGGKLTITSEKQYLANTQQHWSMEGRGIVREANVETFVEHPDFAAKIGPEGHSPPVYGIDSQMSLADKAAKIPRGSSLYKTPDFSGPQQWGMTIDLNSCTGCNACVIACQSENNIPIVGRNQVLLGREMHWIRIDRYFASEHTDTNQIPHDPQVVFMSMMCQHCELAPCEMVCPVNATVHNEEGLNVMAYNRCVGTKYCANNCPYKVRRFNFFDWNKRQIGEFYKGPLGPSGMPETLKMQKNPDVTVRMRGVMEKCTYCVQRIEEAKINQRNKAKASGDVKVLDGAIKTACEQVCPADAITFGDVTDPDSKVAHLKANDRNYSVLGYLNTRPRTTYLARLRNPNPAMPDFHEQPLSQMEYEHREGHHSKHPTKVPHPIHAT